VSPSSSPLPSPSSQGSSFLYVSEVSRSYSSAANFLSESGSSGSGRRPRKQQSGSGGRRTRK
jgi:hypothetical protein